MNKLHRAFFIKNVMTFLIPMLIPMIILGTLSSFLIHQYVTEKVNEDNETFLKQTKQNIELMFNELDSLNLYIVASATEFTQLKTMLNKHWLGMNTEDYRKLASLKNFIDSPNIASPYIDSIYIYLDNHQGRFVTSTTGGLADLKDFYDTEWFDHFNSQHKDEFIWTESRTVQKFYRGFSKETVKLMTMYRRIPEDPNGVIVLNIKANYIEDYLATLSTIDGQGLMILDNNNKIIFKNKEIQLKDTDLQMILANSKSAFTINLSGEAYIVSKLFSEKYGWCLVSLSPKNSLFEVPKRLTGIVLLLLFLSVVGGTFLAYSFTKKSSAEFKRILSILEAVEKNNPLPPLPSKVKNIYGYIIQSILMNFMEKNFLKVQLSEKKYKAQAMEFAALQSQLNPHFLYNTLETINWKAIRLTGKPNEVNEMIENLAMILRYSLDGHSKMVSLEQEIDYTLSYIDIQKRRYHNKFKVVWEYDEDGLKQQVVKLILQPLLENSLAHGLEKEGVCHIKIKIRRTPSLLKISVIDNGMGIQPEKLLEIRERLDSNYEQTKHIGLYNTNKRLKLTYGDQYGLSIKSKYKWGTAIHILIPRS